MRLNSQGPLHIAQDVVKPTEDRFFRWKLGSIQFGPLRQGFPSMVMEASVYMEPVRTVAGFARLKSRSWQLDVNFVIGVFLSLSQLSLFTSTCITLELYTWLQNS